MDIAFEEGEGEDLEEIGVGKGHFLFFELPGAILGEDLAIPAEPGGGFDVGVCCGHAWSHGDVDHGVVGLGDAGEAQVYPVDVLGAAGEAVVMGLIPDIGGDEQTGGQADGEAEDIDGGKDPVPAEIAQGDLEVVGEHGYGLACLSSRDLPG
jgi:hypothetical protein